MPPRKRDQANGTPTPDLSGGPIESQIKSVAEPPTEPAGQPTEPVTVGEMTADEEAKADAAWDRRQMVEDAVDQIRQRYGSALAVLDDDPQVVQRRLSALAVPQPGAIFAAMWAIMRDVQGIGKHGSMEFGERYKYRKYDDLKRELGAACRTHGVMLQSAIHNVVNERISERKTRVQVHIQYQFTSLVDGTTVGFDSLGESIDTSDKATSKAMTMALKSALDQAFMLAAEDIDDPDAVRPDPVPEVPPRDNRGPLARTPERVMQRAEQAVYREGDPVPPGGHQVGDRREVAGQTFVKHSDGPGFPNNAPRDQGNPWDRGPVADTRTPQEKAQAAADRLSAPDLDMQRWTAISAAAQELGLMEILVRTSTGEEMALKHLMVAVGRTLPS